MRRFNLKSALIVLGLLALWFASFQMTYIGYDIRKCIRYFLVLIPVVGILFQRGARQAFWTGFGITALCMATQHNSGGPRGPVTRLLSELLPDFGFSSNVAQFMAGGRTDSTVYETINDSLVFGWTVALCFLTGWVTLAIYRSRESPPTNSP